MFGPYTSFILPSYVVSVLVIVIMIVRIMLQYKARQREIARLEAAGIKRRSAK
ncbi:MAG: heme exporter protein CcmD [Rhizobiaceae bacterium]|nr:heme exporter protein CcmD [Rhizobiaceae bacterium]